MSRTSLASRRRRAARGPLVALLTAGLLAPVGATATAVAAPTGDPVRSAAGYLVDELGDPSAASAGALADTVLALAATGSGRTAGDAAVAALAAKSGPYLGAAGATQAAGNAAKALLAAEAQGTQPGLAADAEAALRARVAPSGQAGSGAPQLFVQSLAVLALSRTDGGVPAAAVTYLTDRACDDGSFAFDPTTCGQFDDVDVTALAVQALLAADADADVAVDWLLDAQDDATGAFEAFATPNVNSTATAAQALRAAGETDAADAAAAFVATLHNGCDAPAALRGSFDYAAGEPGQRFIATSQAPFATSAPLDQLDGAASTATPATLNCSSDLCPTGAGTSVVVDFTTLAPELDPIVACVTDVPAGASGFDVLEAAGFDVVLESFDFGDALCSIDGRPELADDQCFADDGFFSYWNAERGGPWTEYQVGGSDSRPAAGTIEGWSWAPDFVGSPPRVSTTPVADDGGGPGPGPGQPGPTPPYDRGIAAACTTTSPRTFSDIAGSVHEAAIRCIAGADVARGVGDGSRFAPSSPVTRAQLASFLARTHVVATGAALPAGPDAFGDDDGSVHEDAIDRLAAAGVIRGVGDGTRFAPQDPLTRGQMASLIDRFLDLLDDGRGNGTFPARTGLDVFADDTGSVHAPAIDRLAAAGVVQGLQGGGYGPQRDVTRGQVATFLARGLDLAATEGHVDPIR